MFFENLYNNCRSLYKVRMADFSCSLSLSIKSPFSPSFMIVLGKPILVDIAGTEDRAASENREGPVSAEDAMAIKSTSL